MSTIAIIALQVREQGLHARAAAPAAVVELSRSAHPPVFAFRRLLHVHVRELAGMLPLYRTPVIGLLALDSLVARSTSARRGRPERATMRAPVARSASSGVRPALSPSPAGGRSGRRSGRQSRSDLGSPRLACEPFACGLPADAHPAGGISRAGARFYAGHECFRPFGVSLALGCCLMGKLLCCVSRQLTACGNPPYLSPSGYNNLIGTQHLAVACEYGLGPRSRGGMQRRPVKFHALGRRRTFCGP